MDFKLLENCILYKSGYKYQLTEKASIEIELKLIKPVNNGFILYEKGILSPLAGYAWDGPSGPAVDTKSFMRASLFHDVLYQLMREGYLSWEFQKLADKLLKEVCKIDRMFAFRRAYVWLVVRCFGQLWSKMTKDKILTAP